MQRPDGSWPIQLRAGAVEDANSDSNFCAYIATGVWHHVLVTGDRAFAAAMWPVVSTAIDFVIDLQIGYGEISWARSESGPVPEALLTGCASIYHSMRCALALADYLGEPQPEWEVAVGRAGSRDRRASGSVRREGPATRWTGTTRSSVVRCADPPPTARIDRRWDDFVVAGPRHPLR